MCKVSAEKNEQLDINGLIIDSDKRRVCLDGKEINLTSREFDLLLYFARNPGRVYSRSQLLDAVWGYGHEGYEAYSQFTYKSPACKDRGSTSGSSFYPDSLGSRLQICRARACLAACMRVWRWHWFLLVLLLSFAFLLVSLQTG